MTKSPQIYQIYRSLLKKYGRPRRRTPKYNKLTTGQAGSLRGGPKDFWEKWCKRRKTKEDKEEIVIGAILTQRTNWRNVELALRNLKREKVLSIKGVYQIFKKNKILLGKLIKPSGFYKQKAKRLFQLCCFIVKNYGTLEKFFDQDLKTCRRQLLSLYGIGPETADSILLYAGGKPIFVSDEYTRRFAKKHHLSRPHSKKFLLRGKKFSYFRAKRGNKVLPKAGSYDYLQQLFQQNLPKNTKIYQDFHAMIILEGKKGNKI